MEQKLHSAAFIPSSGGGRAAERRVLALSSLWILGCRLPFRREEALDGLSHGWPVQARAGALGLE